MSFLVLLKMVMSFFSFETSSRKMFLFVNLILRNHSGEHCRSPLWYKDRPKCNSRFLESGFPSSHLILSPNVLADISCSLNCYLVEMTTGSLQEGPKTRANPNKRIRRRASTQFKFRVDYWEWLYRRYRVLISCFG